MLSFNRRNVMEYLNIFYPVLCRNSVVVMELLVRKKKFVFVCSELMKYYNRITLLSLGRNQKSRIPGVEVA